MRSGSLIPESKTLQIYGSNAAQANKSGFYIVSVIKSGRNCSERMWPRAPTAFSQPQPCHAALHCGELISMKDCGLSATMTCKLS